MNVRFHRLAVAEIDHEVDHYEARQTGLGEELEDEIDTVLSRSRRFPKRLRNGNTGTIGVLPCSTLPVHAAVSDRRWRHRHLGAGAREPTSRPLGATTPGGHRARATGQLVGPDRDRGRTTIDQPTATDRQRLPGRPRPPAHRDRVKRWAWLTALGRPN